MLINSKEQCSFFGLRTPQKPCGTCNKDCVYAIKEEKKMTNRQWLESLSDEELAMIGYRVLSCNFCPLSKFCKKTIYIEYGCNSIVKQWLQAEHKE